MTILEKIKFEEDWLSEVSLTKENVKIAFGGIRATALESQPCEDAISRTELLRRIDAERNHLLDIKMDGAEHIIVHHARRIIEDMPTVKPQQRWIPVSDNLPEDYIHVLCQFTLGGMGECYLAHGVFHVVGGLVMTCNEVIAWMPLPEPYNIPEQTFGCAED